jgi:hypothetical protein
VSISGDTLRENLTLTEADLAACRPVVAEGGHVVRALCPFHGSDRQRSLRVQVHSGRFVCFACGAWGYMETARERWRAEPQRQAAFRRLPARRQRVSHRRQSPSPLPRQPAAAGRKLSADPPAPRAPVSGRPDLAQQLAAFQAALPGSRGATYLQQRGIPLALAQQLGVGYAAPRRWPSSCGRFPAARARASLAPPGATPRRASAPAAGPRWTPPAGHRPAPRGTDRTGPGDGLPARLLEG